MFRPASSTEDGALDSVEVIDITLDDKIKLIRKKVLRSDAVVTQYVYVDNSKCCVLTNEKNRVGRGEVSFD